MNDSSQIKDSSKKTAKPDSGSRRSSESQVLAICVAFVVASVWETQSELWDYGTAITVPLIALAASWLSLRNTCLIAIALVSVPIAASLLQSDVDFPRGTIIYRVVVYSTVMVLMARLQYWENRYRFEHQVDPLTGCLTREEFLGQLQTELDRSLRSGQSFALLFLDCDRFKEVNDIYGHSRGDDILKLIVTGLRQQLRPYDRIGRYGGDEFMVLIPGIKEDGFQPLAERLRVSINLMMDQEGVGTSCSIGSLLITQFDATPAELISYADALMYEVKERDGNGTSCSVWPETPTSEASAPEASAPEASAQEASAQEAVSPELDSVEISKQNGESRNGTRTELQKIADPEN